MKRTLIVAVLGLVGLGLAACEKDVEAPDHRNVCYQAVPLKDGTVRFNVIANNQPSMEECAAQLDTVRYRYMRIGGDRSSIIGAYNGQFLFLDSGGMSTAPTFKGGRFVAFGRNGDGTLVIPTTIPQPGPNDGAIPVTQNPLDERKVPNARPAAKK